MDSGQAPALELNEISRRIIDAAIQVHKRLGPDCSRVFIENA